MANNRKVFVSWEGGGEKRVLDATKLIVAFVVIIGAAIYSFVIKDWVPGVTIIFLALALIWYLFSLQKSLNFSIGDKGITEEDKLYRFEGFGSFWVSSENNTIYLVPKSKITPILPVMLGNRKPEDIIKFFPKTIVKTESKGKDMADAISDFLHK